MVVYQPFENGRLVVDREIADLDNENYTRQAIGPKRDARLSKAVDARRDAVVRDLCVMECDAAIFVEGLHAKFEVREDRRIGVLAVDETDVDLFPDLGRIYRTRVAVDGDELVHFVGGHGAKFFQHAFGRIVKVRVIETACVGLAFRPFVDRVDPRARIIKQVRLDTSAKIRSDLEVFITRSQIAYRELDREE